MKRIIIATILACASLGAYAAEVTFNMSNANKQTTFGPTDGVSLRFESTSMQNNEARLKAGNKLTVSGDGANVTQVVINYIAGWAPKQDGAVTASTGSFVYNTTATSSTWTGSATSVVFTDDPTKGNDLHISSIVVSTTSTVATQIYVVPQPTDPATADDPYTKEQVAGKKYEAHSALNPTDVTVSYGDGFGYNAMATNDKNTYNTTKKRPWDGKPFLYTTSSKASWANVDLANDNIIPRTGSFVRFEPEKDGTIVLYTILFAENTGWITSEDKVLLTQKSTLNYNERKTYTFSVKKGYVYYYYSTGIKNAGWASPIYGFEFTPLPGNDTYAVKDGDATYNHRQIRSVTGIIMTYGGWLNEADNRRVELDKKNDTWGSVVDNGTASYQGFTKTFDVAGAANPTNESNRPFTPGLPESYQLVPSRGVYYKFTPRMTGTVSVFLLAGEGKPIYIVDENGDVQEPLYTEAAYNRGPLTKATDGSYSVAQKGGINMQFRVYPGKSYFVFANGSKLGMNGFLFTPVANQTEVGKFYSDIDPYTVTPIDLANLQMQLALNDNQWNSITLPFSMNESQVRDVFGEGTEIMQFDDVVGNTIVYKQHYYQYIIAGQPCLIRPTHGYDHPDDPAPAPQKEFNYFITQVHIDAASAKSKVYKSKTVPGFEFRAIYDTQIPEGGYIVSSNKVYRMASQTKWKAFRSVLVPVTAQAKAMRLGGFSASNDAQTTGINTVGADSQSTTARATNGNIYTLQGVLVRRGATTTEGLPAGIYVMNGKKFIVK